MNANYLNVLAAALKTAINERNGQNAAKVFENLRNYKNENENEANEIQKYFNAQFSKLELATAKQLTKHNSKNVATNETAKNELNILTLPVPEQMKKVKNALSGYIATAAKGETLEFATKYTKTAILTEFDALTESDFCALYSGATLQPSKVYRAIIVRLEKAAKGAK
jgi:transketolase